MNDKTKKNFSYELLFLLGILVFVFGCKDETYVYRPALEGGTPFDPNLPVEITGFIPDSGKIREKVIITGSNFGNNIKDVQVFFNDGFSDKKATVVSVNGNAIYCLTPRLSDGESQIKVVVSEQAEATSLKTFRYKATANVSWVAGVGLLEGVGAKYNDGTLAELCLTKNSI